MDQSSPPAADYNLRILWPLTRWLEDHQGADVLDDVLRGTGVTRAQLEAKHEWVSSETFEHLVARAHDRFPDDESFIVACSYRIKDAYGPIRYLLWATSPETVYVQAIKNYKLVSTVGRLSVVASSPTHLHMRVEADGRPINRLTCLVRQANCRALSTLWGLPAAHVKEDSCVGRGAPTCELHLRWYAARSIVPALCGAAMFGALGNALVRWGFAQASMPWLLALLGGALGYFVEVQRTERLNRGTREEIVEALRQIASEEAEARDEMMALNVRQRDWTRLVEDQMRERTDTLQKVVDGMQELQDERVTRVLGFSHDLRNPLQVIQFGAEILRARCQSDTYLRTIIGDMDSACGQMRRMIGELVKTASSQKRPTIQFAPRRIEVRELIETLQRRLRALVHGRDVRTTVFGTREVPAALELDPLFFDRIVDNLLANAAKYTEHGAIVLELDGTPGYLVLKISDTGCGIDPASMDRIFEPGGSMPESRRGDSFGVGLSIVVRLLDQIGGRLEVMSKVGEGTTFWVHLPLQAADATHLSDTRLRTSGDPALNRVVRVRRLTA